jgi:hypothetical protein
LKEQTENNIIHFNLQDLVKHGYVVQSSKIPEKTKDKIQTFVDNNAPSTEPNLPQISEQIVSKLKSKAKNAQLKNFYINEEHKNFCSINTYREELNH